MGTKHGEVHWSELGTKDVEAAKAYYTEVCGWTFDSMPMEHGTYYLGMVQGAPVGGLFDMSGTEFDSETPHWMTYIAVDDVDAAVARGTALGGTVDRPCFDVPGVGRIAIVKDSTGARVGLMTPASQD